MAKPEEDILLYWWKFAVGGGGRLFFTYFYFLNISCLKIRKKYLCSLEDFVVVVVQRPFIENQKNVTK